MTWLAPHGGRPGRMPIFSNAAIHFCLSTNVLFKLTKRQSADIAVCCASQKELRSLCLYLFDQTQKLLCEGIWILQEGRVACSFDQDRL